jgi:methyl-galactoside transport system substrate-binding protein
LRKTAKSAPDVQLLMNDSQNDQSKQNDQIDVLLAKGVKALAINLVDPAAAGTVIEKARGQNVPVVFFNKESRLAKRWTAMTKPSTSVLTPKSPGLFRAT